LIHADDGIDLFDLFPGVDLWNRLSDAFIGRPLEVMLLENGI
jgi:hypothetical protein